VRRSVITASLSLLLAAGATSAGAIDINTGDPGGAYHGTFCPRLEAALQRARLDYTCKPSKGTPENIKRVQADPRQIGFGQLDILALEGALAGTPPPVTVLRRDDARECLFAVTRNKDVTSYGDLAANASRLRFILPPADSGSAATFRYLQSIDPDGLGKANVSAEAPSTDDAIAQALSADDTVTLFVQQADPDNPRFRKVTDQGGHFVPVIDRAILRQQVAGEKIYYAEETQVANANWSRAGVKVVTACTPLVIFTGATERVTGDKERQDHRDLIATVRDLKTEDIIPTEGVWKRLVRLTRELSATSVEEAMRLSEEARKRAKPLIESAKEATGKAIDAAKPAIEKATEAAKEAIDRAEREAKELMEKARPAPESPPAEKR
jgi:ketosteroid isomerase-like protein